MRFWNWLTRPGETRRPRSHPRGLAPPEPLEPRVLLAAFDVSPPAILQWFESSHDTMIERAPDLFRRLLRESQLVLITGEVAGWLPDDLLQRASVAAQPSVLVIPDVRGRVAAPDLASSLRRQLGMAE